MVYVCDAIMGSGKSSAAIAYMNERPDRRYVYITPYLDEAKRIRDGCPSLEFAEPSDKIPEFNWKKLEHTRYLLENGYNITSTHAAFRAYTPDMLENIRKWGYTLLMDEAVDVFCDTDFSGSDVKVLLDGGYIEGDQDSGYHLTGKEYEAGRLEDLFQMLRCNNLLPVESSGSGTSGMKYYYWAMPKDVLLSFSDVIIMTYLFDDCELKYFLDMNAIRFSRLYVNHDKQGYYFIDKDIWRPEYVKSLHDKIHVFDNKKLNAIGDNRWALSAAWFKRKPSGLKTLKNNLFNFFHNYMHARADDILWSTYDGSVKAVRGRGFYSRNDVFNLRASNKYRDVHYLAYCVNVFASPPKVHFFARKGVSYNEEAYALSIMVQWIWRSAIRDGEEVYIYIPSRRMRELLINWIDNLQKEIEE